MGIFSYQKLVIDAVPDITNVQVQINSEAPGYSPLEAEQRITIPIELLLSGIPHLEYTRSISRYGLSQITVVFEDGTDIYFARQLIAQRLQETKDKIPAGITPTLGPVTTGLGEIFMFTVESEKADSTHSLEELREIQDWVIKPQLRTVPGVVEINSIGGASKQILVTPDLDKIRAFDLTLNDLSVSIAKNNENIGAAFIEQEGEQYLIRVPSQIESVDELNEFIVAMHDGVPIKLGDLANVSIGSELRTGAATEDSREVVLGTVFMLIGENGRDVSESVKKKLEDISNSLPPGVITKAVYDRSNLVNLTIKTVQKNLFEGALLVIIILFAALGNFRAALITALVIPISMLMTIFGMAQAKLSANLMSLGALDFGLIVDGAVILVENCIKRFGDEQKRLGRLLTKQERLDLVFKSSSEVRQATMFGELIIMIVYIPILALTGVEGKMFHPMALTVLIALFSAFILSLTFVPAAVAIFITGKVNEHANWIERAQNGYRKFLKSLFNFRRLVIGSSIALFIFSLMLFTRLGSEFIPKLDEGDIALHSLRIPGTSLTQAIKMQNQLEHEIRKVGEVSHTFAKIGTAEIANDPMPPSVSDGFIMLKPRDEWEDPNKPKSEVLAEIEKIALKVPGNNYEFTQPIEMRFNELIAGVRSDLAIKIFGDNQEILLSEGQKIKDIIQSIDGASDVKVEQITGLSTITIKPIRSKLLRYGINASDVQEIIQTAYAGHTASRFYQGDRSFPIVIRLSQVERENIERIGSLPISLLRPELKDNNSNTAMLELKSEQPKIPYILLKDIANIEVNEGPNQISRENGKRRIVVTANIRNRDLGSFVEDAQKTLEQKYTIPTNYWINWGGKYENLISAQKTLMVVVPTVLLCVFGLIFLTFRSLRYSLLVFSGVPFALSGGIIALWFRDIPFSISAAVGFIALSGVSVLNGLVLVSFIKNLIAQGNQVYTSIIEGSVSRLRPVMMTAFVASLGFVPMAISHGTGSEVQRPLATVVIGGIISSTLLTLLVLPLLISIFVKDKTLIKNENGQ